MSHNIDTTTGKAGIAFLGSRNDIWHRLGQEMVAGMSTAEWARAAGLDWHVHMVPAFADISGTPELRHLNRASVPVDGARHLVRSDTGHPLGYVSDRYRPVQPADLLAWFDQYIAVDDRFHLDVAGSLKSGEIIWATAKYNGEMDVAGNAHTARLLMTTTFDGTGSTINRATMTRVVCNNTLNAALADKARSVVKTRHNTRFDAAKVGRELAQIASGFDAYKRMGDAMAQVHLASDQISRFFKSTLDIPFDAKKEDISTRKFNQFQDLNNAYSSTVQEGTEKNTAWAALNAVTRYVDHDRSTRSGASENEARFLSSQFGSGAALKEKAVSYLVHEHMDDATFYAETSSLVGALAVGGSETDDKALLAAVSARTPSIG